MVRKVAKDCKVRRVQQALKAHRAHVANKEIKVNKAHRV